MQLTAKRQQGAEEFMDDLERQLWRVNWRQHGYPYCGIYTISPESRWPTKIGISQNPVSRLISLQNACWKRLDIAEYRYCANFNEARTVEQKSHEMLRDESKLLHGEWFDIHPDKALEVIEFAALTVGIELQSTIPDDRIKDAILALSKRENRKAHIEMEERIEASFGKDSMRA